MHRNPDNPIHMTVKIIHIHMMIITMMTMTTMATMMIMSDNASAWAPQPAWWVGSIEREEESVLRITPRLMNLFKGPK